MYINPLNNGKLSDYNSLKKQKNKSDITNKYINRNLKTKPTEIQKYYQYLTFQQPILDELNYVSERMRTEDIKTKTDDYNFIEDLKIKREKQMKENANREKDMNENKNSLFDKESIIKQEDTTPIINTDVEMETPVIVKEPQNNIAMYREELFGGYENIALPDMDEEEENFFNPKKEKFELRREADILAEKEAEEELKKIRNAARNKANKEARKEKKKEEEQEKENIKKLKEFGKKEKKKAKK